MDDLPLTQLDMLLRLTVAMVLGLIVGAQRSRIGKRAGMRTFALVSVGAALFVVISLLVVHEFLGKTVFDPLRVASQIVVGIGFLGAGVIFVERQLLTGLTTAAALWVVAAVGAAAGFGFYTIAAYVAFLTLFIFEILWYIEVRFIRTANTEGTGIPETQSENASRVLRHTGVRTSRHSDEQV